MITSSGEGGGGGVRYAGGKYMYLNSNTKECFIVIVEKQ